MRSRWTTTPAVGLAEALWSAPVFERRAAAVEVLSRREQALDAADLPLIERLIRKSRTCALVDGLAGDVAGSIVARQPSAKQPSTDGRRTPTFGCAVRRCSPS